MYHALGDPLVIEMEDLLAEVKVLQERRTAVTDLERVLVVGDWDALLRRQPHAALAHRLMGFPTGTDLERSALRS
jgi:hypothetical protein